MVGIAAKGDQSSSNSCQDEANAREFAVAHLDARGRFIGETSVPDSQIEGCATWVDRALLDDEGRVVIDGSFDRWPSGLIPGDGGPESARLVARVRPDGSLDESFDDDGVAVNPKPEHLPAGLPDTEFASLPLPGGGTVHVEVVGGDYTGARLVRYNRAGDPERGYGGRIAGIPRTSDMSHHTTWELIRHGEGILGFGRAFTAPETGEFAHVVFRHRLHDGKPDLSFGTRGFIEPRPPRAGIWSVYDLATQPDGKPVVAGVVERGKQAHLFAGRFTTAGKPDATFGKGGFAEFPLGRSTSDDRDWFASVASDGDKLAIVGWSVTGGARVFRLRANGGLDITFAQRGSMPLPKL